MDAGYMHGVNAPGRRGRWEAARASQNLLRAHGAGMAAFRAEAKAGQVGLVVNLEPKHPATDRPEDLALARRADAYVNRQFLEPVFQRRFPEELAEVFGVAWPEPSAGDLESIGTPIDFLGVHYYPRTAIRHDPSVWPLGEGRVPQERSSHTEMGWEVYPDGLLEVLTNVRERCGEIPVYVTENGAAFYDPPVADRAIDDPLRVDYLWRHLRAVRAALDRGVDVRGIFAWSPLDDFEWGEGFSKRFGLVRVDFETQHRTPKKSSRFYAEVIRSRGAVL